MTQGELVELLRNGEGSGLEFKLDDVAPQDLAREIVAFANFRGGRILLGVDDEGRPRGIRREHLEEWVMQVCRDKVRPEILPYFETVRLDSGAVVAVVEILPGLHVHHVWHNNHRHYYIRVGSTSREASPEELQRLFQQRGQVRFDLKPVPGASRHDLDLRRLRNYFSDIRGQGVPSDEWSAEWDQFLLNTEVMVRENGRLVPSVGGLLLFGEAPQRFLPQAGISAFAFPGTEKDYAVIERGTLRGPLVGLFDREGKLLEPGLVEETLYFVRRNTRTAAFIDEGGRRIERPDYPWEAVREAVVNALVHRDYTISGTDIEVSIYEDRLEVISPGRLPNTITVERMRTGCRATRNELIKEVMRDYGYIEHMGMGVPRKIIRGMRQHNGTDPDLVEGETDFLVRLWKRAPQCLLEDGSRSPR